jgi:hypothetical protein
MEENIVPQMTIDDVMSQIPKDIEESVELGYIPTECKESVSTGNVPDFIFNDRFVSLIFSSVVKE